MRNAILFSLLFTLFICDYSNAQKIGLNDIFKRNYQRSFISNGDNLADFLIKKDSMDFFLVSLHDDVSINEFQIRTGFSLKKVQEIMTFLESKKWLHKVDDKYRPTIFIATQEDGVKLYKYAKPISNLIANNVVKMLPNIKAMFNKMDVSNKQSFDEWSFFILSNVLLDNWQILNVENRFLGANSRPNRHGKYYYASLLETNTDRESFCIYGNSSLGVYGNNRKKGKNVMTNYYISPKDNQLLNQIAEKFLPELLNVLQDNKNYCLETYKKLGYSNEISFEEFFIWWYHFIYTQTTNILNDNKILTIPENGNFFYKIDY
jgi:hypothetical protein